MKKLLFLLFAAFIFAGCEKGCVSDGRELYNLYFKKILKDPSSLVIYNEKFTTEDDISVKWELDYGAKNSYGGMVRRTIKFTTISNSSISIDDGDFYRKGDLE